MAKNITKSEKNSTKLKKLKLPKKISLKKASETAAPVKEKKISKTAALKKQFYVSAIWAFNG